MATATGRTLSGEAELATGATTANSEETFWARDLTQIRISPGRTIEDNEMHNADKDNGTTEGSDENDATVELNKSQGGADPPGVGSPDASESRKDRAVRRAAEKLDALAVLASKVPSWVYLVILVGAVVAMAPWEGVPKTVSPGSLVGGSLLLVWLARVALLMFGAVFLLGIYFLARSILARIIAEQWIFKVGNVETDSESTADVKAGIEELEKWQQRSQRLEEQVEGLTRQLGEANGKITVLEKALDAQGGSRMWNDEFRVSRSREGH